MNSSDTINLEKPTSDLVARYVKKFGEDYSPVEDALRLLFEHFPKNNNLSEIIVKVAAIDAIYSTNIRKKYAFTKIAQHIFDQKIDEDLARDDPAVVEKIAQAGKSRVYSFATKYCHFHKQESYPVFDSFVEKLLIKYKKSERFADFNDSEMRVNYSRFLEVLKEFIKKFDLRCTLKELDMFLWSYGKELNAQKKSTSTKPRSQAELFLAVFAEHAFNPDLQ